MTCQLCGQPTKSVPAICPTCLRERARHRARKAKQRAQQFTKRQEHRA